MSDGVRTRPGRSDPNGGFTLIEVLIVAVTMGAIMVSLSMVVATVLRTAPGAEARDDDARTLLGLTTYMPEDVNSTPPAGFDFDKSTPTGCAGASPGVNLVRMTWTENGATFRSFEASYRYVDDGEGYRIVRYACETGQTAQVRGMTSELPHIDEATWSPGDAPVEITPFIADSVTRGLTVRVTTVAGDQLDLEMRTNNPAEVLPVVPPGFYPQIPPGNQSPTASDVHVTSLASTPVDVGLPASDPDGDGLTVTVSNVPAGWTTAITGLTVRVTPPVATPVGTTVELDYAVTDPYGQIATAEIEIEIVAVPTNQPPTASDYVGSAVAGTPLILDLPVSDPDGDPLTVAPPSGVHPSLTVDVTGPTQITVTSNGSHPNPGPFNYTVSDGSLTATAQVRVTVTQCNVTGLTPASATVQRKNNGRLKNNVVFSVSYTGPCTDLVLEYDNDLSDGYQPVYLSFGAGTTVTVQGHPGGLNWTTGTHVMTLRDGHLGPALATATLEVT